MAHTEAANGEAPKPPSAPALLTLSARAAARIRKVAGKEPRQRLRLSVSGGGCSGFQYEFKLDTVLGDDDVVIERDGAELVIDEASLPFIAGSEVDFVEELAGSYFTVSNPNATASCGCGNSFSIF